MALVNTKLDNGIMTISLNRPEKRNALSFDTLRELIKIAQHISHNPKVRCVILTGEAEVFSSGLDLSDLQNPKNSLTAAWQLLKPGKSLFQQATLVWRELPVPVIAVIQGYCFGAGLQLALAADIRICHPKTELSIMESRWGLVPDMGLTQTLAGLVGVDTAKELCFSARIIAAEQAKDLGLVTYLSSEPLNHAEKLAQEFIQRSPDAILAAKRVLNAMQLGSKQAIRLEKIWQLKLLLGKNSKIAQKKAKNPETNFVNRQYR